MASEAADRGWLTAPADRNRERPRLLPAGGSATAASRPRRHRLPELPELAGPHGPPAEPLRRPGAEQGVAPAPPRERFLVHSPLFRSPCSGAGFPAIDRPESTRQAPRTRRRSTAA